MKNTINTFIEAKDRGEKLALLTAYDYASAKLIDSCNVDGILVGDSLGMVCLGYEDTLRVTMEDMIHHCKAVSRGTSHALLIGDLPFMSYQASVEDAVRNAGRLVKEGRVQAVKLEGGRDVLPQIKGIRRAQIPVMGHIGLTPQSINMMGGYRIQGRDIKSAEFLLEEAKILEEAGIFALVLECIPKELGAMISKSLKIPTIGIGAGNCCDGQVLVLHDAFSLYNDLNPSYVKVYEDLGAMFKSGISRYVKEVKESIFPDDAHSFHGDKKES